MKNINQKNNLQLQKILVNGTPYQRGTQYGEQLRNEIRDFLSDNIARINSARFESLTLDKALSITDTFIPYIERDVPDLAEEIKGLADGAGISYREGMLLQVRREIISSGLECTAFACRNHQGDSIIAQNVDLAGNLTDLGIILQVNTLSEEEPDLLMYTHVGLIGYLGLNSFGLGIGLNMVLSSGWRAGVPPYLLIRHLLHQKNVENCLREIKRIRRASSRNLLIADKTRLVDVEMTVQDERIIEENFLVHTNHYVHPDLLRYDLVEKNTSTYPRYERTVRELQQFKGMPSVRHMKDLLGYHEDGQGSLCVHNGGDPRRVDTIASVILEPSEGKLSACKGHPCNRPFQPYYLERK
ncbi:putative choloylglycine hydrolase [Paenibacillus sp. DS2015]|uniref:C45 family autoproteolytic acyltransferase/hydolase n=1 Tax=Paenibacillus sp. DS2015 TaxID=3373917 RepID=UPI003D1D49A4